MSRVCSFRSGEVYETGSFDRVQAPFLLSRKNLQSSVVLAAPEGKFNLMCISILRWITCFLVSYSRMETDRLSLVLKNSFEIKQADCSPFTIRITVGNPSHACLLWGLNTHTVGGSFVIRIGVRDLWSIAGSFQSICKENLSRFKALCKLSEIFSWFTDWLGEPGSSQIA